MKNSLGHDEYVNTAFFSLASQLYVKMRRLHGRVIDSVYMTQNQDYAREILRLARINADAEMNGLIQRIEQFVPVLQDTQANSPMPEGKDSSNGATLQNHSNTQHDKDYSAEEISHHYIGALR